MEQPGTALWRILLICCCCGGLLSAVDADQGTQPAPQPVALDEASVPAADEAVSPREQGVDLTPAEGPVAIASIDGMIDPKRERYLQRMIEDARDQGVKTIILHINTDGGQLLNARNILETLLDQAKDGPRLIAYVDYRAISAGAMIAYGCDEIVMTPPATIGDMGVIRMKADGGIEYAPEKIQTPMRALLARSGSVRGWPRALLMKMMAQSQLLYRVARDDGYDYVIEEGWQAYLADHSDVDPDDEQQVIVFRGKDRLLTLTGIEAVKYGMATTLVDNTEDLLKGLGVDRSELIDLKPDATSSTQAASKVDNVRLTPAEGPVAIASIDGMIDPKRERYLQRMIEDARDQGIKTIILHINTDGGYVFSGRDILKTLLDQAIDGPRLVAYVDYRAISAGAMIAYGCDEIVLTPSASIGDIGVIRMMPDGTMEYGPEKIEAPVRTLLTLCSEVRGWSRGMLLKMTARNQLLYRVAIEDGYEYIIEDDWPAYLADHPDIDPDDKQQVIVFRGEDRLLTLTGKEAVGYDMATTLVDSKAELLEHLQVDEIDLIDLQPTATEETAWFLSSYAGLFLGLAMLFVFLELKTAGVGLFATLAAVCGGVFLFTTFSLEILTYWELSLLLFGFALVAVELFTGWSAGVGGAVGGLLILIGGFLAFMPQGTGFDWNDPAAARALGSALTQMAIASILAITGLLVMIAVLPRMRMIQALSAQSEITATSADPGARSLVGRRGRLASDCHPGGTVDLDDDPAGQRSARSRYGAYLARGSRVEVVDVAFGECIVQAVPETPETDDA